VVAGVEGYRAVAGDDLHFIARCYWPGMPFDAQRETLRLFAERVAPRLRERSDPA
jgi:hypothetical protein